MAHLTNIRTKKRVRRFPSGNGEMSVGVKRVGDVVEQRLEEMQFETILLRNQPTSARWQETCR